MDLCDGKSLVEVSITLPNPKIILLSGCGESRSVGRLCYHFEVAALAGV